MRKRLVRTHLVIVFAFICLLFSNTNSNAYSFYTTVCCNDYPNVTYKLISSEPHLVLADSYDSVENLVRNNGYSIGINASAWNNFGQIDMTYLDGEWISSDNDAYIADPLMYSNNELNALGYNFVGTDYIESIKPDFVLTGYNAVIWDTTKINTNWNTKHDRSFIGQFQDGSFIIGVMEDASYEDLITFAKKEFGDSIRILYNLDGGGSCGLYIDGTNVYAGRDVKSIIAF